MAGNAAPHASGPEHRLHVALDDIRAMAANKLERICQLIEVQNALLLSIKEQGRPAAVTVNALDYASVVGSDKAITDAISRQVAAQPASNPNPQFNKKK